MTTYTFSEARQKFAYILDKAKKSGKILIKRKDGSIFSIQPEIKQKSPLNVKGVDVQIKKKEIIDTIHKIRRR